MPVLDLYSKRRKAELRSGQPDVFQYDKVPVKLRVQIVYILRERAGYDYRYRYEQSSYWGMIHDAIAREKGFFALSGSHDYRERCEEWFLKTATDEDALDFIELSARAIERVIEEFAESDRQAALEEINQRFREHDLGFQYENGMLVRLDSQYVHANVVKPALALLNAASFRNANEEFMQAHKLYRDGHHKDCVVAALRAYESVLKAICDRHGWTFGSGDRASELIATVRRNRLFPDYLDKSFDTYIAMLKSGLPDVRNNAGGHGESPGAKPVPSYIAAYALHLSATNIVMAVEASNSLIA